MKQGMSKEKRQTMSACAALVVIFSITCFYLFFRLDAPKVVDYDEARHGINAYEMIQNDDYLVHTYEGELDYWNLKPPFSYWVVALGYRLFGYNRLGLRFFSALCGVLTLLALCWFCFPAKRLSYQSSDRAPSWQPKLVWSCLGLYVVFLTALEMNQALWGLALVLLGFLVLARAVIVHVDWSLLLVFMVMFIDVHLLTQLPALHQVLSGAGTLSGGGLWLTAIGLSQVISNVPSTILLLNYVPPSILLAWAVNVGGFGLLPGSLANIIALRMASDRRIWWRFHLYSIPMLLWAALSGYWLFKLSA